MLFRSLPTWFLGPQDKQHHRYHRNHGCHQGNTTANLAAKQLLLMIKSYPLSSLDDNMVMLSGWPHERKMTDETINTIMIQEIHRQGEEVIPIRLIISFLHIHPNNNQLFTINERLCLRAMTR